MIIRRIIPAVILDIPPALNSCVSGLWLVIGDCPSVADLYRAWNTILAAQNLYTA